MKIIIAILFLLLFYIPVKSQQLLTNTGFEGAFVNVAPSWYQNTWSISVPPVVSWSKESSVVHSGTSSQKIDVNNLGDGGTLIAQDYDFTAGTIYEGEVWMRADDSVKVSFMFQERIPGYYVPACFIKKIGPAWEKILIRGGYRRDISSGQTSIQGRFVIQPLDTGTIYIDDASLVDITDSVLNAAPANTNPVPAAYFGIHVNKLGIHSTYPPLEMGMIRLWNTGTEWELIEPYQGALNDSLNWVYDSTGSSGFGFRLDYYVDYVLNHDTSAAILYTMGQTPAWSAANASLPPANISDWNSYTNILANRFRNKIKYWEPWNEVDYSGFYSGSYPDLVTLAQSAHQQLKNADTANVVLTPNFTSALGLSEYLYEGGGNFADIFSWHHYPSRMPEESIAEIIGIKNVMSNYGYSGKPLWNTEGAVTIAQSDSMSVEESMATVSRTYILQWLFGIENFNWYAWDIYGDLTNKFTPLSYSTSPDQYDSLTLAGISYRETVRWLKGSHIISKTFSNNTWIVELQQPNGNAWIVWDVTGNHSFTLPSSWNILRQRDLYGNMSAVVDSVVAINEMPLLFENDLSSGVDPVFVSANVVAYPNPFSDYCTIDFGNYYRDLELSISDALAREILKIENITGNSVTIKKNKLSSGIYVYVLRKNDERIAEGKLVIY